MTSTAISLRKLAEEAYGRGWDDGAQDALIVFGEILPEMLKLTDNPAPDEQQGFQNGVNAVLECLSNLIENMTDEGSDDAIH